MSHEILKPVPSTLYKYAPPSLERIHEVIVDRQVEFSSPLVFNDPFDCRAVPDISTLEKAEKWAQKLHCPNEAKRMVDDPDYANQRMMEGVVNTLQHTNVGVYCFAEKVDCPLMWAHYAKSHKGVCFEFDLAEHISGERGLATGEGNPCFPFWHMMPVRYEDRPLLLPDTDLVNFFETNFCFKSKDWKYELEWRAVMLDSNILALETGEMLPSGPFLSRSRGRGKYTMDDGLLSGVILGCQIKPELANAVIEMAKGQGLKIRKAVPAYTGYKLEIVPHGK